MSTDNTDKQTKRKKRGFGAKLIWVLNNLSEEKLAHADTIAPSDPALLEFLGEAVDSGIDIKTTWDDYSNCYQVSAIGAWDGFPSAGFAVSARSNRDTHDALCLVWYKVVILADGDLSSVPSEQEEDDLRG